MIYNTGYLLGLIYLYICSAVTLDYQNILTTNIHIFVITCFLYCQYSIVYLKIIINITHKIWFII